MKASKYFLPSAPSRPPIEGSGQTEAVVVYVVVAKNAGFSHYYDDKK